MTTAERDTLCKRLHFILHRGLAEIRNLALSSGHEQIAELADALEILPGVIEDWDDEQAEVLRDVLRRYQDKFPGRAFDYLAHFDGIDPPERF